MSNFCIMYNANAMKSLALRFKTVKMANKGRLMDNSRFSILAAAKNAYLFVGREWLYLLKAGLLPMAAQMATGLFMQFQRPDASQIENTLWGLPGAALFGWFM